MAASRTSEDLEARRVNGDLVLNVRRNPEDIDLDDSMTSVNLSNTSWVAKLNVSNNSEEEKLNVNSVPTNVNLEASNTSVDVKSHVSSTYKDVKLEDNSNPKNVKLNVSSTSEDVKLEAISTIKEKELDEKDLMYRIDLINEIASNDSDNIQAQKHAWKELLNLIDQAQRVDKVQHLLCNVDDIEEYIDALEEKERLNLYMMVKPSTSSFHVDINEEEINKDLIDKEVTNKENMNKEEMNKGATIESEDTEDKTESPFKVPSPCPPLGKKRKTIAEVRGRNRRCAATSRARKENVDPNPTVEDEDNEKYCDSGWCHFNQISIGEMVQCDGCDGWFHFDCVCLTEAPSGKWYCPTCKSRWTDQPSQKPTRKRSGRKSN